MRVAEQVQRLRDLALDPATAEGDREKVVAALDEIDRLVRANPLQAFEWHSPAQEQFLKARTKIVAAFAGNQFGKSTSLVVRSLCEVCDVGVLPEWLRPVKQFDPPTYGWIVCPSNDKIYDAILPTFKDWCPKSQLRGGSIDKAYDKQHRQLNFANGSWIAFKTYEMDDDKFGGTRLHFVGYDEPPPRSIRDECMTRTLRYGGYEMFAMTPLNTNTGWIRRDIYKQREAPHITVVKGSMHDNIALNDEQRHYVLGSYANDLWRRAREFGDFIDVGGLIYEGFEGIVIPKPSLQTVRSLDPVVGIDPGIRNAGLVFGGFDTDDVLGFFEDDVLQDSTVDDYAVRIDDGLQRWGISRRDVTFIIDPAARQRDKTNAETVESALARLGVFCVHGQNDVPAGVQQIRTRIQHKRIWVSETCLHLREEADEYAAEDRADGEFKPIKQNDHALDAARYVAMYRPFDYFEETQAPKQQLGWQPGKALSAREIRLPAASPPLGSMS